MVHPAPGGCEPSSAAIVSTATHECTTRRLQEDLAMHITVCGAAALERFQPVEPCPCRRLR